MYFIHTITFPKFVTSETVRTCPDLTQSYTSLHYNEQLACHLFFFSPLHLKYIQGSYSHMESILR